LDARSRDADAKVNDEGAKVNVFTPLSLPVGGEVQGITSHASKPSTLYVQTAGGRVFRSTDRGAAWSECAAPGDVVVDLSAAPAPGVVLVATTSDVLLSTDSCSTWTSTGFGRQPDKVLALSAVEALASTTGGLWRWQGGTWAELTKVQGGHEATVLRADQGGKRLFLGTRTNGLARSIDGGVSWVLCNKGLTGDQTWVHELAIPPTDPQRLYLATEGGLQRSLDGGDSWTRVSIQRAYDVAVHPQDPERVVVQQPWTVYESTTGGTSFASKNCRSENMALARVKKFLTDGDRLYAATDRGVFATDGWDWAWQEIDVGLNAWSIRAVGGTPSALLLSTSTGILRSANGGDWTLIYKGLAPHSWTTDLRLDPSDPNQVLVAGAVGVLRPESGGTSLVKIYDATAEDDWLVNRVAPAGTTIYAGSIQLLVSHDGGSTWKAQLVGGSNREVQDLLHDPSIPAVLVASNSGLFYTKDDGESFTVYNSGLGSLDVRALARASGGGFWAGTATGLYRSAGLDQPWIAAGLTSRVRALLVAGGRVVAATDAGVSCSLDEGKTWKQLPGLESSWPRSLGLDVQGRLLVGTSGHGLYRAPLP